MPSPILSPIGWATSGNAGHDLDAGVPHLVPNVGGGFAIGDQLGREEVSKVVEAGARHPRFFCNWLPDLGIEHVGIDEPRTVPWEQKGCSRFARLQLSKHFHDALGRGNASGRLPRLWRCDVPLPLLAAILSAPL